MLEATDKNGWTALMVVAYGGYAGTVAALLQGGAAVDLVNEEGWSALTCAARWGNVECARLLLDAGAAGPGTPGEAGAPGPSGPSSPSVRGRGTLSGDAGGAVSRGLRLDTCDPGPALDAILDG